MLIQGVGLQLCEYMSISGLPFLHSSSQAIQEVVQKSS